MLMKAIGLVILVLATFSMAQDSKQQKVKNTKVQKVWVKAQHKDASKVIVREDGADQKIKIVADGEVFELDGEDLELGETRSIELESGKTMEITRGEEGIVLTTGDNEILMRDNGHRSKEIGHTVSIAEGGDFVFVDHSAVVGGDGVIISGLGDLDETAREAIINALREAGVEKEIHFSPAGAISLGGRSILNLHQPGTYGFFTDESGTKVKVQLGGDTVWVEEEKEENP